MTPVFFLGYKEGGAKIGNLNFWCLGEDQKFIGVVSTETEI
jgi:hypothetical protein